MPDVVLISGSPSERSRTALLLDVCRTRVTAAGVSVGTVRVRDLHAEALLGARWDDSGIAEAIGLVRGARAVIVGTPVYKASYSGLLKAFLDMVPEDGLRGAAVMCVATGGSSAHLLAIDYALRPVLATLGAGRFARSVFAVDRQIVRREGGDGGGGAGGVGGGAEIEAEILARLAASTDELLELAAWPAPAGRPLAASAA